MADDPQALRRIDWGACFPFTRLFRIFRLAANHRNLLLLLLAFTLTYLVGTAMDRIWRWGGYESDVGIFAETSERMQYLGARAAAAAMRGHLIGQGSVGDEVVPSPPIDPAGYGVFESLFGIAVTKIGLAREHPLYAGIFGLIMLVIWSLLGGAVCRIIAVDAALDEKISLREAIGFAREKFIGFLVAPLIPYLLVLVIGICLVLGGLIGAIPYVGEIFAGLFFFLALIGGFLIALLVIGAVVGSSLMYPTIAVEGSDAFDAISRSFSYVLTRPWHTLLYAAVSIVYGAICYLFARIVVYLLLAATHLFVGAGMTGFGTWNQHENGLGKLDLMWQMPTFSSLVPRAGAETAGTEYFASWLIALWVWVVVGLLYAFVGSLALSGVTTIYYLLRHDADGTDYEDVYIDEEDVDLAAPPPPPPTVTEFAAPAEDDSIDHDASGSETGDDVDA